MPVSTRANTQSNTLAITHPHRRTYTDSLPVSHTCKQERNSNYLETSPDIACHSQRPWSGFAHRTSYSAHTQTHTTLGRGCEWGGGLKSWGPCWRKRGNPATSAVSVVDSIAASLESDHRGWRCCSLGSTSWPTSPLLRSVLPNLLATTC